VFVGEDVACRADAEAGAGGRPFERKTRRFPFGGGVGLEGAERRAGLRAEHAVGGSGIVTEPHQGALGRRYPGLHIVATLRRARRWRGRSRFGPRSPFPRHPLGAGERFGGEKPRYMISNLPCSPSVFRIHGRKSGVSEV